MRKLIYSMLTSQDLYIEGPDGKPLAGLLVGSFGYDVIVFPGGLAGTRIQEVLSPGVQGCLGDVLLCVKVLQRLRASLARVVERPMMDGSFQLTDFRLC